MTTINMVADLQVGDLIECIDNSYYTDRLVLGGIYTFDSYGVKDHLKIIEPVSGINRKIVGPTLIDRWKFHLRPGNNTKNNKEIDYLQIAKEVSGAT